MSDTRDDIRYALRSMRRNPGFTSVAVVSLALGIGVNTAIFSLVDQLLLWSVPARDPGQLVNIEGGRSDTYPFYREYRDRNQVFSGMLGTSHPMRAGVRPEGAPAAEVGNVSYVSGNYFRMLGVGAVAGRVLMDSDDVKPGGSPVVVLSYDYWQRRFAGSPGVIGRKFAVDGFPLEVAGIAEKGFGGLFNGSRSDAFVPLTMFPLTTPAAASIWNTAGARLLRSVARLKPGVSMEKAQANLRVIWPQACDAVNDAAVKAGRRARKFAGEGDLTVTPGSHGMASGKDQTTNPLVVLMAAAGLVLLIACANIANLLAARATGRRKEIAVRLAMGARRARLVRQLLTESLVLAAMGGAAGCALARWTVAAIAAAHLVSPDLRLQPSLALAAFSAGLTLLTSVLFGLAPALRITRVDLAQTTRESGSSSTGSRVRLGKALIAGQAALSLALLVGAGLFIRTLRNLENVDLGFDREHVLLIDADAAHAGYQGHRLRTFYDELLERTRHIPGVRAAGLSGMTPMGMYAMSRSFSAEGFQPRAGENLLAYSNPVTHGYFSAMGIPLPLGRDFQPEDEPAVTPRDSIFASMASRMGGGGTDTNVNASPICIISESLARHLFGDANPVGRHLSFDDVYSAEGAIEIVGVAKDVRYSSVRRADDMGAIYIPSWSHGAEGRFLAVRVVGSPAPVIAAIGRQLRQMDPNVPLLASDSMEDNVNGRLKHERMIAYLCGCFGALALTLAAVGLYGVMAYAVAQRTREVGIRMALGARRLNVVGMIVREALVPVLFGVAIGIAGALAAARVIASLLFGIAPRDPVSFVFAVCGMLAVALAAASIPARRASRVDPSIALRYE
jgi:predicted permease